MPAASTEVVVARIPDCAIHHTHPKAYADARIPAMGGTWGNVCKHCFVKYGCSLGLGKGQRLVTKASA